ncbi:DUF551 domain-containing protein [Escherichia coli]|uniref:DUF551 domain-containing protein n=1 Tax=Escherichia coli TaxID=562 RepID=UPI000DA49C49|nr:DUF551 domain-containing protein [Escherichia coli]EKV4968066.1 DUF551 domain-containing protein [Escherichia coli]MBL4078422.1 DUF551 domain-containing protein [Escherichia coli]SRA26137.1 phage protein [Escherichia coli]SRA28221.1 phage protein [Escherichia coli]SRA31820.1 phage protein [Escherichia coli]
MTTNHPANGPVSLDRLHQIREHLQHDTQYSNGGNRAYILSDVLKVIDGAIAAFGAEPVGYFYADKPGDWYQILDADRVPEHRRIPLYSNPQSGPVVKLPNEFISSEGIVVQIEKLMAVLAVHGIHYERRGNACRAAMLQAGNSPVTPDTWIPVSERMPEEGQEIIVMDVTRGKVQSGMIYQNGRFVDFNEEYYEVKSPSHWMPLPEAPQQE